MEAITGKPYKPTTQGKNERFYQTLFRYLDKQPLADTLAQLQDQVDAFDDIYNTDRAHQALLGRITPLAAWEATPRLIHPARNLTGRSTRCPFRADTSSREHSRPLICPPTRVSEQ